MATSAFKSTSRRGNYTTNASTSTTPLSSSSTSGNSRNQASRDSLKKTPPRRSRSVSAVQRSQLAQEEYSNTRENPLFDCSSGSSKSSSSEREKLGAGKGRGTGGCIDKQGQIGRARGSTVVEPRERSMLRVDPVRRRLRSVSRGPAKSIESDYLSTDTDEGKIYETVRSEVQRAVSQIKDDLVNAVKGRSTDMLSDSDGTDIASDITTDYASKLDESQERIRKLQAELAVEEQRKEELSKILKEVLSSPDSSGSSQTKPKRRTSIERRVVSRRLEEEAMSYFEECVSISNFDGSDLSSLEDNLPSSTASRPKLENDVFLSNEEIAFAESLILDNYEESENQSPRAVSLTGSDMAFSHSSSYTKYPNPKPIYYNSDLISDFDTPSETFRFSLTEQPEKHTERRSEIYSTKFGSRCDEENVVTLEITKSSYHSDDYISKVSGDSLLKDMVMYKTRLDSGGLLLCNIGTF